MIETQTSMNGINSLQIGNQGSQVQISVSVSLVPYSQIGFNTSENLLQQSMQLQTNFLVKDVKNQIHHNHAMILKFSFIFKVKNRQPDQSVNQC